MTKIAFKKDTVGENRWFVLVLPPWSYDRAERWVITAHTESQLKEHLAEKWPGVEFVEYERLIPLARVRVEG